MVFSNYIKKLQFYSKISKSVEMIVTKFAATTKQFPLNRTTRLKIQEKNIMNYLVSFTIIVNIVIC